MKLTKSKLKQIIKEELDTLMDEEEEQKSCEELEKELGFLQRKMHAADPTDWSIGDMYAKEKKLKNKIKEQGCL